MSDLEQKRTATTPADFLRMTMALLVLMHKPSGQSTADFVMELRTACTIDTENRTPQLGLKNSNLSAKLPLKRRSPPEEEVATSTGKDDSRVEKLEQELAVLKRKLAVAMKELSRRALSSKNAAVSRQTSPLSSLVGIKKVSPDVSWDVGRPPAPLPLSENSGKSTNVAAAVPEEIDAPGGDTTLQLSGKAASSADPSSARSLLLDHATKMMCGGRSNPSEAEANRDVSDEATGKPRLENDTPKSREAKECSSATSTAFTDLPKNVKLLHALLSSSGSSGNPHVLPDLPKIIEYARRVLYQLSQITCLAYSAAEAASSSSASSGSSASGAIPESSGSSLSDRQTALGRPTIIIALVDSLLLRLLPPLFLRLEGAHVREIVTMVVNGVIRPTIDAIIHSPALSSDRTPKVEEPSMLDSATSLVNHLLQLSYLLPSEQDAVAYRGINRHVFPFVDVIPICVAEAVCAKVTRVLKSSSETRNQSPSRRPSTRNPAFNHSINLLLGVIDSGVWHSSKTEIQGQQHMQHISASLHQRPLISRLVSTRVCDLLTKLVARLDSEVQYASGIELEVSEAKPVSPTRNYQASTGRATRIVEPARSTGALWMNIGLERQTMLAMCCLAEQMFIDEGTEGAGGLHGEASFGYLKEIITGGQDWNQLIGTICEGLRSACRQHAACDLSGSTQV